MRSRYARLAGFCLGLSSVVGLISAGVASPPEDIKVIEVGQQVVPVSGRPTSVFDSWHIASGAASDPFTISNPIAAVDVGFTQRQITVPLPDTFSSIVCTPPSDYVFQTVSFSSGGVQEIKRGPFSYALNPTDKTVSVVDLASTSVASASTASTIVNVGAAPRAMAISPNGRYVYVSNYDDGTVSIIKAPEHVVVVTIVVGSKPSSMALSPDGRKLFVASEGENAVYVIDTVTRTVVDTIILSDIPNRLVAHPDGSRLYILSQTSGKLVAMNVATKVVTLVTSFVGENRVAGDMVIDAEGKNLYATIGDTSSNATLLASVDLSSTAVSYISIPMSGLPQGLEIQFYQPRLRVTSSATVQPGCASYSNVYVIDTATLQLARKFSSDSEELKKITGPTLTSAIKLDTGPLTFSVPVGQSKEHVVTLSNAGALPLKIDAVLLVAGESGTTGDFGIKNDTCSGNTIEAGGQCQFAVTYSSAGEYSYTGEVMVFSDSAAGYQPLALSGQGIRSVAEAAPSTPSSSPPSSGGGGAFEPLALLALMGLWWRRSKQLFPLPE
ncbi:MAG: hypothetical protein HYX62_04055 [Gammaproteobacteria bacterium]|nr:hypothetical protein [Gammaproteobacteria bacterium]